MDGDRGSNYPHDTDFFENGNTLFLDTGNVTKNGFKFDSVKYITKEKDEQLRSGKLEKNDFVLTSRGTLGNVGFYNDLVYKIHPKIRINSAMLILRNTDEQLSYNYLHTLLKGKLISDFMKKNQVGSAQPHITRSEFLKLNLNVPCDIEEQNKIGDFFKSLDDTITLHLRKLDLLKQLKQGFLQQMFVRDGEKEPILRFADFGSGWEQRKLGEIARNNYGGGTPKTNIREFWNGNIPWFQSSDLEMNKLFNVSPKKKITSEAVQKSATKIIPSNSIAVVTRVGVGKLALMSFEYATSQDFLSLSELQVDPYFGIYSLYSMLQKELNNIQGTSIKGMTKSDLLEKILVIPKRIEEQKKIGAFFQQLDTAITIHQSKIDKLITLKKAYLTKLFI
ncbi:restriction endonuclease subunit S [Listeria grayi]|nr:restriction endonuclease subunit S [Listeria grayi]